MEKELLESFRKLPEKKQKRVIRYINHISDKNIPEDVPLWEKMLLSLKEAAIYSNIGMNRLREISDDQLCDFVLWVGNKRLIKRKKFEKYIEECYSI